MKNGKLILKPLKSAFQENGLKIKGSNRKIKTKAFLGPLLEMNTGLWGYGLGPTYELSMGLIGGLSSIAYPFFI